MTALEVIAILILIGAILVLLYYYLQNTRGFSLNMRPTTTENRTRTLKVDEDDKSIYQTMKETGAKASSAISKVTESSTMAGMGERMAGVSEKIKGTISTDIVSNKIEDFLNEQSDQLIKDWEIVTKKDLSQLEERFDTVSLNVDSLEKDSKNTGATPTKNWIISKKEFPNWKILQRALKNPLIKPKNNSTNIII